MFQLQKLSLKKNGIGVRIRNQNALMVSSAVIQELTGTNAEGVNLTGKNLEAMCSVLNSKRASADATSAKLLIDREYIVKKGEKYAPSPYAKTFGVILATPETSSDEIARTILHEKKHQRFNSDQSYKNEVISKVESLSPEQKTLGYILLRIPGGYDDIKTVKSGGVYFEKFATEIDAHASMQKDGFDVSKLITKRNSDFKSSVKEVYNGLVSHFLENKNLPKEEIDKEVKLEFAGNQATIKIENQTFTIRSNSKGKLDPDASSIKVSELPSA